MPFRCEDDIRQRLLRVLRQHTGGRLRAGLKIVVGHGKVSPVYCNCGRYGPAESTTSGSVSAGCVKP